MYRGTDADGQVEVANWELWHAYSNCIFSEKWERPSSAENDSCKISWDLLERKLKFGIKKGVVKDFKQQELSHTTGGCEN